MQLHFLYPAPANICSPYAGRSSCKVQLLYSSRSQLPAPFAAPMGRRTWARGRNAAHGAYKLKRRSVQMGWYFIQFSVENLYKFPLILYKLAPLFYTIFPVKRFPFTPAPATALNGNFREIREHLFRAPCCRPLR